METGVVEEPTTYSDVKTTMLETSDGKKVLDEEEDSGDADSDDDLELPDDVYSMLFVANWKSVAFWFAILVFAIQLTILGLVGVDLTKDAPGDDNENKLNVPPIVETPVAIAQGIALMIAVLNQDDITLTLILVAVGLSSPFRQVLPSLQAKFPGGATQVQFWLANFLRILEGLVVVFVSFIFIVQADNVLDIFLNFAAIEFVAELDNLCYRLASEGWFGERLKLVAKKIGGETLPAKKEEMKWARHVNLILLLALLTASYAGWGVVRHRQDNGYYLKQDTCSTLDISFGDEVYSLSSNVEFVKNTAGGVEGSQRTIDPEFDFAAPPELHYAYFSGKYEADFKNRAGVGGERPVYYEASEEVGDNHDDTTLGMFYFCETENAWVFSIRAFVDANAVEQETVDRCTHGWLMRSPITDAATLDEVPTTGWRIWTGILDVAEDFSISCIECKTNLDCGGQNRGTCEDSTCQCEDPYDGDFCTEDKACEDMVAFVGVGNDTTPYFYSAFPGDEPGSVLKAYDRPVYSRDIISGLEVLLYTGRRWYDLEFTDQDFESRNADLHAYWGNLLLDNTIWYSKTTNNFLPTGPLEWFSISKSQNAGNYGPFGRTITFPQRFECLGVDCSRARICGTFGQCFEDGTFSYDGEVIQTNIGVCVCEDGVSGHFCEFHPDDRDV